MPGLDPGIHQKNFPTFKEMDCRVKPGNDDAATRAHGSAVKPDAFTAAAQNSESAFEFWRPAADVPVGCSPSLRSCSLTSRRLHGGDDQPAETLHHIGGRIGRCEDTVPAGRHEIVARLAQRRNIGQERRALPVGRRQNANAAALVQLREIAGRRDDQRDLPADQIVERSRRAAIRHMAHIDVGGAREHRAHKVRQAPAAGIP